MNKKAKYRNYQKNKRKEHQKNHADKGNRKRSKRQKLLIRTAMEMILRSCGEKNNVQN